MDYTAYSGHWIVCGSYALLHATDLPYMDLIPLENSTGASFGTCCAGKEYNYTRLLTVFRDFNYGIDAAAPLWGIQMNRVDGETKEPITNLLNDPYIDRILIGPVSMTGLIYLPLSGQYRYVDHFITCIRHDKNTWRLIDSENVPGLITDSAQIIKMLSIQDIPEACNLYTARVILDVNMHTAAENKPLRLRHTLQTAYVNLKDAQEDGQGYWAFYKCAELLQNISPKKYESVLYSVDYLIQRKIMLLKLLQEAAQEHIAVVSPYIVAAVNRFIETAGALRGNLNNKSIPPPECLFCELAEAEKKITEHWEEWVQYDSH